MNTEQILISIFIVGFLAAIFIGSALADNQENKQLKRLDDEGQLKNLDTLMTNCLK